MAKFAIEIHSINRKEHLEEAASELQSITPPLAFRDSPMPRLQRKMAIRRRSTSKSQQINSKSSIEIDENKFEVSTFNERQFSSSLPDLFNNSLIDTKYLQVRFDRCFGKQSNYHYSIDLNEEINDENDFEFNEDNIETERCLELNQLNTIGIFLSDSELEFNNIN